MGNKPEITYHQGHHYIEVKNPNPPIEQDARDLYEQHTAKGKFWGEAHCDGDGSGTYNNAKGGRNNLVNGIERGRSMEQRYGGSSPQSFGGGQVNWGCAMAVIAGLILVGIILLTFANWQTAGAAPESGSCYVYWWQINNIQIAWSNPPRNGYNYQAVFMLYNEDGESLLVETNYWKLYSATAVMQFNYNFAGHIWTLSGLFCKVYYDGGSEYTDMNPAIWTHDFKSSWIVNSIWIEKR